MQEISRKMASVAALPLKLDLQLFADENDGTPNLEDSPEFRDDAREFDAKMAKYVQDREAKQPKAETPAETKVEKQPVTESKQAETPEVAEPEEKLKQDSETNKAFQEMRKQLDAEKKQREEIEARAKRADNLIAQQYGHMGITTVEQYEAALKAERDAEETKRYEESGLKPEEIEKIRKYDELQKQVEQQKQTKTQEESRAQWQSLYSAYPELSESSKAFDNGGEPEWLTAEMKAELARGASPLAAYRSAHFDTIMQKTLGNAKEIAKQEALDKLNSKEHLAPNAVTGGEVDHVEIDDQTMRMYRALNKGKTDAQIRAWHKKNAMGG